MKTPTGRSPQKLRVERNCLIGVLSFFLPDESVAGGSRASVESKNHASAKRQRQNVISEEEGVLRQFTRSRWRAAHRRSLRGAASSRIELPRARLSASARRSY